MRKIELIIQKEEDIVLLMQGINWIRKHILIETKETCSLMEKLSPTNKKKLNSTLDEHIDNYDRLMTLLSQLDNLLENKGDEKWEQEQ